MSYGGSRSRMVATQQGICLWCKLPLPENLSDVDVDHIIPRIWGGPDVSWNRQLLHSRCNAPDAKGDKLTDEARELAASRGITLTRKPPARALATPPGVMSAAIQALRKAGLEVDEDVVRVIVQGTLPAIERYVRRQLRGKQPETEEAPGVN